MPRFCEIRNSTEKGGKMSEQTEENYGILHFNEIPFYFREGNFGDMYTIRENLGCKQYKQLKFNESDIILDIGGHIGTFAVPLANKVRKIVTVEMDPDNYKLLEANVRFYKSIISLNKAVVSNEHSDAPIEYYKANKNSGAHSMYVKRRRGNPLTAEIVRIGELLSVYKPTIIKCDVEGAEYDIFNTDLKIPDFVKQIIIEFHFGRKEFRYLANIVIANLQSQGFLSSDTSNMNDNKNWTRVIYFERS